MNPKFPSERTACLGLFVICVVFNLAVSAVGFRNSLREVHEFRQLQTALSARSILEEGWKLDYPMPLFGPPWTAPMEFPIYQVCVAKLTAVTGMPLEIAGRSVALFFFYLTLPALVGLAGVLGISRARRWLFPCAVLLSPAFIYYSRSFMIESTAVFASAWFLLAYCRALTPRTWGWLAAAVFFGVLAALAKVTTFMVFLGFAGIYTLALLKKPIAAPSPRRASAAMTFLRALGGTVPGVIAGTWWVCYSDRVKLENPLASALASGPIRPFSFGTLAQRLSGAFWEGIMHHANVVAVPFNLALILVFAVLLGKSHRARGLLLVGGAALGPLIFANLYFVHDYYFYANGLFLLGALVLAWDHVLDLPNYSTGTKWSVVVVSLGLQVFSYFGSYFTWQLRPPDKPLELALALSAATKPEDVLLVFGQDWEAKTAYYSHRKAMMITDGKILEPKAIAEVLDRLPPGKVTALVVTGSMRKYPAYFEPLIERLALHSTAVLVSENTLVYLAEAGLADAMGKLGTFPLETFRLVALDDANPAIPRVRYNEHDLRDSSITVMMNPKPVAVLHPFGLAATEFEGRSAFSAHAPTDIVFDVPVHGGSASADFGIFPSAYTGSNATEGVEFRIELVTSDNRRQLLHTVYLSPSKRQKDRGEHHLHLQLPADASGKIWFRTLPGPTGSIACAWAYWTKIEIK